MGQGNRPKPGSGKRKDKEREKGSGREEKRKRRLLCLPAQRGRSVVGRPVNRKEGGLSRRRKQARAAPRSRWCTYHHTAAHQSQYPPPKASIPDASHSTPPSPTRRIIHESIINICSHSMHEPPPLHGKTGVYRSESMDRQIQAYMAGHTDLDMFTPAGWMDGRGLGLSIQGVRRLPLRGDQTAPAYRATAHAAQRAHVALRRSPSSSGAAAATSVQIDRHEDGTCVDHACMERRVAAERPVGAGCRAVRSFDVRQCVLPACGRRPPLRARKAGPAREQRAHTQS